MPVTANPMDPRSDGPPPTLASRPLPRRVRRLLEAILELAAAHLDRVAEAALNEFEQQLFKLTEQAHTSDAQLAAFEALRTARRTRSDVSPRFMIGLEAALACLRDPPSSSHPLHIAHPGELALVTESEIDRSAVVREIANRAETRASLGLWLLGQRFGVIAGKPAFEPEALPIGPYRLCELFSEAGRSLELDERLRILLLRCFERAGMADYPAFVEAINALLIREEVLPRLTFVPMRIRAGDRRAPPADAPRRRTDDGTSRSPSGTPSATAGSAAGSPAAPLAASPERRNPSPAAGPLGQPQTHWLGEPMREQPTGEIRPEELFGLVRELLALRRQSTTNADQTVSAAQPRSERHVASREELNAVLGMLQQRSLPSANAAASAPTLRPVRKIKEDLLMQLRMQSPDGEAAQLPESESDTMDLVGMLFEHIMRDVRPNSPAAALLSRLQIPLLRLALDDPAFFVRSQHPARQMLNTIAETGAPWLGDDEADQNLVSKMQSLVDRAVKEFDGDPTVFESLQNDLGQQVQAAVRRAETAERRHVEAARGKERLAQSQQRASEVITERLRTQRVPSFVRTLLTQAWSDVLALTLLRSGEDSEDFGRQVAIAERLISAATAAPGSPDVLDEAESAAIEEDVARALGQVGYHDDDARAIARRLARANEPAPSEDDAASRTELALKMKARSRLGRDVTTQPTEQASTLALSDREREAMEHIKQLPFGTWFEFHLEPENRRVRRRMSWYSTITGHALFVNNRGQRIGEQSLDQLARELASGKASVVQAEKSTLIDRAWTTILGSLRTLVGQNGSTGGSA